MPWADQCSERAVERRRLASRRHHLRKTYGISVEDYDELLKRQDGKCAACDLPPRARGRGGRIKELAVDHDHDTGELRGLLCHSCNVALGLLQDDMVTVWNLLNYRAKFQ